MGTLATFIGKLLHRDKRLSIVQIGSMDGRSFDPIYETVVHNERIDALLVEPVPHYFEQLKRNYAGCKDRVKFENAAIFTSDCGTEMFVVNPVAFKTGDVPHWAKGISSLTNTRNALDPNYWETKGKVHTQKHGWTYGSLEKHIEKIKVQTTTFKGLLEKHSMVDAVNVIVIDAEGYDYEIVKMIDLDSENLHLIQYESANLTTEEKKNAEMLFKCKGFQIFYPSKQDTVAFRM